MKVLMRLAAICVLGIVFLSSICHGWLRMRVDDAVLVERSELIVVGRLQADSIKYVPHKREKNEGVSWEHHGVLAVTEVLKGELDEKRIPIVIHYGLDPYIGGLYLRDGRKYDYLCGEGYPKDRIAIMDTGNSAFSFEPLVKDAGQDNIWFLQRRAGRYGRESGTGRFGIADPEDVQPLSMKRYFIACLSEEPDKALKKEQKKNPDLADRVRQYLIYSQLKRELAIADPNEKARRLLRYFFGAPEGYDGRHDHLVRKHVAELRGKAVAPIIEILKKAEPRHKLDNLMYILCDIGKHGKPAVPYLLKMLEQRGRTTTYYVLAALKRIGDPSAIDSVRPFLGDKNLQMRTQAAETLAWLGDTDSFDRIAAAIPEKLDDQHVHFVKDICGALYRLDPARARPIIKKVNARTPTMDITRFISRYRDDDK